MSLFSRSLFAQIALVLTLALLAASAVNFAFLLAERSRAGLIEESSPAITRLVDLAAALNEDSPAAQRRQMMLERRGGRMRGGRISISDASVVDARSLPRSKRLERRILHAAELGGLRETEARASTRLTRGGMRPPPRPVGTSPIDEPGPRGEEFGSGPQGPPDISANRENRGERFGRGAGPREDGAGPPPFGDGGLPDGRRRTTREIVMSLKLADGRWLNSEFVTFAPRREDAFRLAASTVTLFAFVLGAALLLASRLSRPLRDLAHAAEKVGATGRPEQVVVRGPGDVRRTIEAFNVMSQRVSELLTEKDATLGALGHDLRTPLASLRIRVEGLEPESEREKAISTIEETSRLLDAILELARNGRSSEPLQMVDFGRFIDAEVDAWREQNAPVTLQVDGPVDVACQPLQLRRLVRHLVDNALAYAGSAHIRVWRDGAAPVLDVADDGPGMSAETLETALRPFFRGDASRNRGTGGAGLGLALADAIARAHGGKLTLSNRPQGGLLAQVRFPPPTV